MIQLSHIIEDTIEPSLPAREINLKACAGLCRKSTGWPGNWTRLLR